MTGKMAAEANGADTTMVFDEETYTIPTGDRIPIAFLEAIEDNELIKAMKVLTGEAQWKTFRAKHTTIGDVKRFFEAAGVAMGGNS